MKRIIAAAALAALCATGFAGTPNFGNSFSSVRVDGVRLGDEYTPAPIGSLVVAVIYEAGAYHMWYRSSDVSFSISNIKHAVSADGVNFATTGNMSYASAPNFAAYGSTVGEPPMFFPQVAKVGNRFKLILWTPNAAGYGDYTYNACVNDIGTNPNNLSVTHQGPIEPVGTVGGQSNGPWGIVNGFFYGENNGLLGRGPYNDASPPVVNPFSGVQDLITPLGHTWPNRYPRNHGDVVDQMDGTLGCFYTLRDGNTGARVDKQVYYSESSDNGQTWSAPGGIFGNGANIFVDGLLNTGDFSDPEVVPVCGDRRLYFSTRDAFGRFVVVTAMAYSANGLPVDLCGSYFEPKGASPNGRAIAVTAQAADQVLEASGGIAALEGTFTPFSDAHKKPAALEGSPWSKSWQFDVDLSGLWSMAGSVFDVFFTNATGTHHVYIKKSLQGFRFDHNLANMASGFVTDTTGATKFRITVSVSGSGVATTSVMTLNGANPCATGSLGSRNSFTAGNSPGYFGAGFTEGGPAIPHARIVVSNFATTLLSNVIYAYAANPYVRSGQYINYTLGMANLQQPVVGYQAFVANLGAQTFAFGNYTSSPFGFHFRSVGTLTGLGQLQFDGQTGGAGGPFPSTQADAHLAQLSFVASPGSSSLAVDPDNGNPLTPTRFSGIGGVNVPASRASSNTVVTDDVSPLVTIESVMNNGNDLCEAGSVAYQGSMVITVTAEDLGVSQSGLRWQPTVLLDFTGPNDISIDMHSDGGNVFVAEYQLSANTPCGPLAIRVSATDDSGNLSTVVCNTFVNVEQITVNLTLLNFSAGTVTRGITFVVGGAGGANAPHVICKDVQFANGNATVVLNAADGLVCGAPYTRISAKDTLHTLRKLAALGGTNGQFTATLALKGGDANDDNVIDILDFAIFAGQYGQVVGANTPCGFPAPHPDFSGDGFVGTADYTFIAAQFLQTGDNEPGNFRPAPKPKKAATVKELLGIGVKQAPSMDLDGDGWVTYDEIRVWIFGKG